MSARGRNTTPAGSLRQKLARSVRGGNGPSKRTRKAGNDQPTLETVMNKMRGKHALMGTLGETSDVRSKGGRKDKRHMDERENDLDANREAIPKRQRASVKAESAKSLAKKILENGQSLKNLSKYGTSSNSDAMATIPDSLEDLESDDENAALNEVGRQVDAFLESKTVQRVKNEQELRICFDCTLYEHYGTLDHVFRLNKLDDLDQLNREMIPLNLLNNPFALLFFTLPNSALRCQIIAQFLSSQQPNGHKIHFRPFMLIFCYVFQLRPEQLRVDACGFEGEEAALAKSLDQLLEALGPLRIIGQENKSQCTTNEEGRIQQENVITLLDSWAYLNFTEWRDVQLIALLCALCRLYLDADMVHKRNKVASALNMTLDQLANERQRLDKLLFNFGWKSMLQAADGDMGRVLVLFTFFIQFDHFQSQKLPTVHALLKFVVSQDIKEEIPPPLHPSLADVLQLLPEAVQCLKERDQVTDLYLVYNRLIDELTIDDRMLDEQTSESLEKAVQSYQEASALLNKRNINDKMIHSWARSIFRIKQLIQNRRNEAAMNFGPSKSTTSANTRYFKSGLSSSDEEEEGAMDKD